VNKSHQNTVVKSINVDGLVGWIGDFGKPVSISDSVKGVPVRDVLKHGVCTSAFSDQTEFNVIRFKGVTLKISYDRRPSVDDDIQVFLDTEGKPLFDFDE
jgi:hypothetical protein